MYHMIISFKCSLFISDSSLCINKRSGRVYDVGDWVVSDESDAVQHHVLIATADGCMKGD